MKTVLLAAAASLVLAASAQANSLTFSGTISPGSDPHYNDVVVSRSFSSCSSATPQQYANDPAYDAYAVRNISGADDCVTVTLDNSASTSACIGSAAYVGSFNPAAPLNAFAGGLSTLICNYADSYVVAVPAGGTVVPLAFSNTASQTYLLTVEGASLALADTVDAGGSLPKNNTFSLRGSVLKDGTGAEGSVSVSSASGKSYSGPVTCLEVDGDAATLVASITGGNQDPKYKAVAFWLQETPGTNGAQRNSLLTQAQLDRLNGTCPAPGSKPTGALTSGHVSVVDTPATD